MRTQPALFDGPVVVCAGLEEDGPRALALSWARTTYRHFALRRVPGLTAWLPSLFVAVVQPSADGRVLVGRTAPSTAVPGRWQLPGGSVEPPDGDGPLDERGLRENAARELAEETGVDLAPDALRLWLVTHGARGHTGVLYRAPALPPDLLRGRRAALVCAETAAGREPEFDRLALVRAPHELAALGDTRVDYLEPVVHRCAAASGS
ncbi:NUDIX hydrolase [Streptomyces sp. NPDC086766]|uniref:NUDIX hydrolase n=1 Tax=Streptomyces sp. NPDC086766 TaxID=3365754 RepID=UPI003801530C